MDKQILDYLSNQRVGVLAVATPDGGVHGATIHFAYTTQPFSLLIGTSADSLKGKAIMAGESAKATFVVGFSEDEMLTFQADGEIKAVSPEDEASFDEVYLGRFPRKKERVSGPRFLRAVFVPKWWRFSDMKNKITLTSD